MSAETEHEEDDFVDTSIVPPTLLMGVWTPHAPGVADGDTSRTLAIPPALVAEALA